MSVIELNNIEDHIDGARLYLNDVMIMIEGLPFENHVLNTHAIASIKDRLKLIEIHLNAIQKEEHEA